MEAIAKPQLDVKLKQLTDKQKRFIEEYCIDFNGAKAAQRAGFSAKTAPVQASQMLRKPHIKAALAARAHEFAMPAEEAIKHLADIARGRLNDYLIVREVPETPLVEKPLVDVIAEAEQALRVEELYAERAGLTEQAYDVWWAEQQQRKLRLLRLQVELEVDPTASRWVEGAPRLVKRVDLDLVKLKEDKEADRIKTFVPNKYGVKIEMYAADAALRDILRLHGLYVDKADHTSNGKDLPATNIYFPAKGRA